MPYIPSATLTEDLLNKYRGTRDLFIETGTHKGGGIWTAYRAGMHKFLSCDPIEKLCVTAKENTKEIPNVSIVQMSSESLFSVLEIREPAVFWLDGHFDDATFSPIISELKILRAKRHIDTCIIMIDDRRIFAKWGLSDDKIIDTLREADSRWNYALEDNSVAEKDVFVAYIEGK